MKRTYLTEGTKQLQQWKARQGLSQRSLADILHISYPHVCQLLSGAKGVSLAVGKRIEDATGIPMRSWATTPSAPVESKRQKTRNSLREYSNAAH